MRVCHVTPAYPDDERGHREGHNYRKLCEQLAAAGVTCLVVTARQYRDAPEESQDGPVPVRRFVFGDVDGRLGETGLSPMSAFRYMRAGVKAIRAEYAREPFDVLHAHMPVPCGLVALRAARKLGVPVIVTAHGSDLLIYPDRSNLMRRATVWVLRHANRVIAVSEQLADKARELAPGIDVEVIPIGYDGRVFSAGLSAGERAPVVISTRNLSPVYRVETLVDAARELGQKRKCRVVVFGEGPEREKLEARAEGTPVEFRGFAAPADIAGVLRRGAVYVSTSESDGTSVSLLEAMASGIYPVVTDIPANRAWIAEGEEGSFVPVGDAHALAEAIASALDDEPRRDRAALTNPGHVASAAWDAVVPRWQALYDAVVQ